MADIPGAGGPARTKHAQPQSDFSRPQVPRSRSAIQSHCELESPVVPVLFGPQSVAILTARRPNASDLPRTLVDTRPLLNRRYGQLRISAYDLIRVRRFRVRIPRGARKTRFQRHFLILWNRVDCIRREVVFNSRCYFHVRGLLERDQGRRVRVAVLVVARLVPDDRADSL